MLLNIDDGSVFNQWEEINKANYLGITTDNLGQVWIGNNAEYIDLFIYEHQDLDSNGIGDICDPDSPWGDNDGDGILNADDMYPNDGPLGDWDGDGILNNVDPDDSTPGYGLTESQLYHSQGANNIAGRIPGKREQDTQPYPESNCGQGNPCIQGTAEWNPNAVPGEETSPYEDRPDCDNGWVQGTNDCILE